MNDPMQDLHVIEQSIRKLEEHHNDVLDLSEATTKKVSELREETTLQTQILHRRVDELRDEIHARITKAKRATVILSLLAQEQELRPVKNRIDQQPYEFYATSEWFKKQLREQP